MTATYDDGLRGVVDLLPLRDGPGRPQAVLHTVGGGGVLEGQETLKGRELEGAVAEVEEHLGVLQHNGRVEDLVLQALAGNRTHNET